MKKTQIILKLIFLLLIAKLNAQKSINGNNVIMNFDHQNSKDLLHVITSMNNSLVFQKNILSNIKGIYIRSINGKQVDLNNLNFTVNNTKVFQFDRGLKTNMENYLIFDCEIMYSVHEINIQFLSKDFENKEKLTIKLIY
jgi:hypothetical protein